MSPTEVRSLTDNQIVELLVNLRPGDECVAWLASVIASPVLTEGVAELHRRYRPSSPVPSLTSAGRHPHAGTVSIDPERFRSFFWKRRIALVDVGGLMEPARCEGWASTILHRGRAGFYALDALACALGLHVDSLIDEVGTDDERARLSVCV